MFYDYGFYVVEVFEEYVTYLGTLTANSLVPGAAGCVGAVGGVDIVETGGLNRAAGGCDETIGIRGVGEDVIRRGEIFVFAVKICCGEVEKR